MALDKENHVVQSRRNKFLLRALFARLKNRLNGLGASTGTGAMHAIIAAAMMRAQLSARDIEYRLGHRSPERRSQNINGRRDRGGRVASFEEINQRLALRRHFLAQMKKRVIAVEPRGID